MPSTIVDSAIFGNIFSTDAMRAVWSDENRTQKYLDIEAALARVQARLEIIPQEAADEIPVSQLNIVAVITAFELGVWCEDVSEKGFRSHCAGSR